MEHYGLQNDEDIKTLEASFTMQAEQKQKQQQEQMQKQLELSEEDAKIVEEEIKGLTAEVNSSGILPLETFIKVQQAVTKTTFKLRNTTEQKHADERRELLKQKKEEEYIKCVNERQMLVRNKATGYTMHILKSLNVNPQVW